MKVQKALGRLRNRRCATLVIQTLVAHLYSSHSMNSRSSAIFTALAAAAIFGAATPLAKALPELPHLSFWIAAALMALGIWLHVRERHEHQHTHEWLEHTHRHRHDEHHQHEHDFAYVGDEPHTHPHVHLPITHSHAHFPNVHHRHSH